MPRTETLGTKEAGPTAAETGDHALEPLKRQFALIVAMTPQRTIGGHGTMLWHLPSDLKRFKRVTLGHDCIMGTTTYRDIVRTVGGPLPHRRNIIISRTLSQESAPGCTVVRSPEEAVEAANVSLETFVIGGAKVYAAFLRKAQRLLITTVHRDILGDAHFPDWERMGTWRITHHEEERHIVGDTFPTSFTEYTRVA